MVGCKTGAVKVIVVGTGAVGSYYGGRLAEAGAAVAVVCRSDYDEVRRHGIRVKSCDGDFHFQPERVLRHTADYPEKADYVLVTLKVLPQIDVVERIRPLVHGDSTIVLIQNGVGIEDPVAAAFPENEIISGLAFICVARNGPGEVWHQDYGRLVLGVYPKGRSPRLARLAQLFRDAGVPCEEVEDVVTARWHKLLWNAPFNPLSVLAGGVDTRWMLGDAALEALVRSVMAEVTLVASALGHGLPAHAVDRMIQDTRKMTPYKTSMLLDYEAGRPLEVEAILGNAVRAAKQAGVPVPRMETLYALLRSIDEKRRQG